MPFRTKKTDIWQYDIVVKGDRFRGSTGTKDFEEAKAVEAQIRAEARARKARGGRYTLSETFGTYYRDVVHGTPSDATTRSQMKAILKHLDGRTLISDLTNAMIFSYTAKDRATCKNATVNRRLQMMGRALKHMRAIYQAELPVLDLKTAETKEPRERIRELSFDEQDRLFDHLPAEHHAFVKFALLTGARIGTIADLQWNDIDLQGGNMFFRMKGEDVMTFPMTAEVRALLTVLPKSNVLAHRRFVFTRLNEQTLERVPVVSNGGVFNQAFRDALRDAEISDFRFHDLRHTFATRMLRQCKNLKLVSKLLGHSSIESTVKYAHVLVDDMRDALEEYSALSGDGPQKKPQTKS